jgi:hypothetical protein
MTDATQDKTDAPSVMTVGTLDTTDAPSDVTDVT